MESTVRTSNHERAVSVPRVFSVLGAVFAGVAVAAGAFGAHTLKATLTPAMLDVFETGVRYQMYHAVGLFLTGWAGSETEIRWFRWAGWLFVAGIVLFCGSLYLLSATGTRWLGAVTPLGGLAFILGWGALALGVWRTPRTE